MNKLTKNKTTWMKHSQINKIVNYIKLFIFYKEYLILIRLLKLRRFLNTIKLIRLNLIKSNIIKLDLRSLKLRRINLARLNFISL